MRSTGTVTFALFVIVVLAAIFSLILGIGLALLVNAVSNRRV